MTFTPRLEVWWTAELGRPLSDGFSYRGCGRHWRHLQPDGGPTTAEAALVCPMGPTRPYHDLPNHQYVASLARGGCSSARVSFQLPGVAVTAFGIGVKPLNHWAKKGQKGAPLMTCRQPCRCPRIAPITGFNTQVYTQPSHSRQMRQPVGIHPL